LGSSGPHIEAAQKALDKLGLTRGQQVEWEQTKVYFRWIDMHRKKQNEFGKVLRMFYDLLKFLNNTGNVLLLFMLTIIAIGFSGIFFFLAFHMFYR
jgi:hypothetical protein